MSRTAFSFWKPTAVAVFLLASACGKGDDLPSDVSSSLNSSLKSSVSASSSDDDIKAAIPKILLGLEEIKQEIKGLQVSPLSTASTGSSGTTKPATGTTATTKPATGTTGSSGSTKPATASSGTTGTAKPSTPATPAAPSGTDELKTLLKELSAKTFVQASVEKTEKSLKDGHVTSGKMNMYTKAPNLVKVDVTYASSGSTGAKVIYNSGDGTKAKIRPGGSLSFITTELAKTDDRLTSTNEYKLDDIDTFGLVRRLSSGYTAETVGKSQLADGTSIYILKVKTSGTNSLDSRIAYEYLGYEPDSHKLRLWEIYSADSKDPFFRMALTKIEYPASIPDSTFKL